MMHKWPVSGLLALLMVPSFGVRTAAAAEAVAFNTHCARCHPRTTTLVRSLKGDTRDERAAALATFLQSHHCEDPRARAAIVSYLVGLSDP
jgi:cytochrome c551/c552